MANVITDYEARWNTDKNTGEFLLTLEDGKKEKFNTKNSGEFLAVLALLQGEKAVFLDPPVLTTKPKA